jgi:hypothetical protein
VVAARIDLLLWTWLIRTFFISSTDSAGDVELVHGGPEGLGLRLHMPHPFPQSFSGLLASGRFLVQHLFGSLTR